MSDAQSYSLLGTSLRIALEQAVARVIRRDRVTARRLGELDGQVLQIISTTPEYHLFIRLGEQPELLAIYEHEPDCTVQGSAIALLRLGLAEEPMGFLRQSEITLSGNSELLNTASAIIREADFDWDGLIARYTGGVVAHWLGTTVRNHQQQARTTASTILANLPEYIQEELRVLPAAAEVDNFQDDLDQLRLATDRLQARIERLELRGQVVNRAGERPAGQLPQTGSD